MVAQGTTSLWILKASELRNRNRVFEKLDITKLYLRPKEQNITPLNNTVTSTSKTYE